MAHQVLITFDIDEAKVQENAEKEAAREIIRKTFGERGYYNSVPESLKRFIKESLIEILEPEKEQIIKEAVKETVENLHRTKLVKQMLEEAKE